jgi:hypothetical protein
MKIERTSDDTLNLRDEKPRKPRLHSPPEGFISKHELARRLQKSIRTISYWQRCGILPYVKCQRSVYYDWSAVTAHLARNFRVCRKPSQTNTNPSPTDTR